MPFAPGYAVGPYEIVGPLGSGSMGEVYRARDRRLGREVAVKVLPERFCLDADRLRRFEQEAQAASALNHPNILVVHDFGAHEGRPYLVTELLEGESLAERLARSAIPPDRALDYATQIAKGLAAAHAKGIVHRDFKPSNLFITDAGVVKILDFGLAKISGAAAEAAELGDASTAGPRTAAGAVLGSAGYMAPEQVRGQEADRRSDIFSFGAVLYEMLSGKRAFHEGAWYDTMNAVVQQDPPPLPANVPPPLARLVCCCLEKRPADRFQSAHDLTLALASAAAPHRYRLGRRVGRALTVGAAAIGCIAAGVFVWQLLRPAASSVYRPLTFKQGTVSFARFTSDGQTIFYSAAWDAKPFQLYSTRMDNNESSVVNIADASNPLVMAVSKTGEMALLLPTGGIDLYTLHGTLARVSVAGGEPQRVVENVGSADWSPDGSRLAIAHLENGGYSLEYPVGKKLCHTEGSIDYVRVSPHDGQVAFLDHPLQGDLGGSVAVVDEAGRKRTLSSKYNSIRGLAWAKDGNEIWFSAADTGSGMALYAVTLRGAPRRLEDLQGYSALEDIARDGRALIVSHTLRRSMFFVSTAQAAPVDLYYRDASQVQDLTHDFILFAESGAGTGRDFESFLRRTDVSPTARHLGTGLPMSLSPDGKWVIANPAGDPAQLVRLPTGAGTERALTRDPIHHVAAKWLPDGRRFVFVGRRPGGEYRYWVQSIDGGEPLSITKGDIRFDRSSSPIVVSPDGAQVALLNSAGAVTTVPIAGGAPRPVTGAIAGDVPLQWCGDRSLIVRKTGTLPVEIYRIDLATGRRTLWRSLVPSDSVGLVDISPVRVSGDCRSCAYSTLSVLSVLNAVSGLR